MHLSPYRTQRPGEAALTVSLLWVYIGCRASARALGAVQAVLPRQPRRGAELLRR